MHPVYMTLLPSTATIVLSAQCIAFLPAWPQSFHAPFFGEPHVLTVGSHKGQIGHLQPQAVATVGSMTKTKKSQGQQRTGSDPTQALLWAPWTAAAPWSSG